MTEAMSVYWTVLVIVFGLLIGSFLNVVIVRLPRDQSLVKPPSHCPKCKSPVRWFQNLPVISYLALRGKCAKCQNPISVRYPIVELITALLFLAVYQRFGWSGLLVVRDFPFVAILVAITFIDLEHRIIPDVLSLGGLVLGLLTAAFTPGLGLVQAIGGAALGFSIFYGMAWAYQWKTGLSGMGGGDIKLLAMLGAFVGPMGVVTTILISSIAGSVIGLIYAFWERRKSSDGLLRTAIPFGPFLVVGALYHYLLAEVLWYPFMSLM